MNPDDLDIPLVLETEPLAKGRIEAIEKDIQEWADKPIDFSFDPSGTGLFSMEELGRAFAKRAADFSKSIRMLLANGHIIPATVVGRALVETVSMGCLFLHDMDKLVAAGDVARFDARLQRFYAGVKGKSVEPVHVMDAIRYLEQIDAEYVQYLDNKHNMFALAEKIAKIRGHELTKEEFFQKLSVMKNYDLLSEVSHPNGTGTQFMYGQPGPADEQAERLRKRFHQASLMSIWACHHLLVALKKNEDLPERYRAAFLNK
jgi:hypothetical protein